MERRVLLIVGMLFAAFAAIFFLSPALVAGADREPILVRSLYMAHLEAAGWPAASPAAVADAIVAAVPADAYVFVHFGTAEPLARELADRGKQIWRYTNIGHASGLDSGGNHWRPRGPAWEGVFGRMVDRPGHHLEDEKGVDLLYRWYRSPRIVRWDGFSNEEIDELVAWYVWLAPCDRLEFDVAFRSLAPWMLEDSRRPEFDQARLEKLYNRERYRTQQRRFIDGLSANFGQTAPRPYFVNGSAGEWRALGVPAMYENANRRLNEAEFQAAVADWAECPDCVLEVRDPAAGEDLAAVWRRLNQAVEVWLDRGGFLWVANGSIESTPACLYAWARVVHWRMIANANEDAEGPGLDVDGVPAGAGIGLDSGW